MFCGGRAIQATSYRKETKLTTQLWLFENIHKCLKKIPYFTLSFCLQWRDLCCGWSCTKQPSQSQRLGLKGPLVSQQHTYFQTLTPAARPWGSVTVGQPSVALGHSARVTVGVFTREQRKVYDGHPKCDRSKLKVSAGADLWLELENDNRHQQTKLVGFNIGP